MFCDSQEEEIGKINKRNVYYGQLNTQDNVLLRFRVFSQEIVKHGVSYVNYCPRANCEPCPFICKVHLSNNESQQLKEISIVIYVCVVVFLGGSGRSPKGVW